MFKLESLALSRCLIHLTPDSETQPSTWFYNCSVLEDILTNHYTSFILQQAKDAPNTLLAGNLIRVGECSISDA